MQRVLKRHNDVKLCGTLIANEPVPVDKRFFFHQCTEKQNRTEHFAWVLLLERRRSIAINVVELEAMVSNAKFSSLGLGFGI